jgi:carbonic anhydrase
MLQLLDRLSALGVDRHKLPENLVEYFGLSGSERQNVLRAAEIVRASPLIGTKVPVHGLMLDVATGRVECIVNGYDAPATVPLPGKAGEMFATAEQSLNKLAQIGNLAAELKVPTGNIGQAISTAEDWLHKAERVAAVVVPPVRPAGAPQAAAAAPPKTPPTLLTTLQDRLRQRAAPSSNPSRPQR